MINAETGTEKEVLIALRDIPEVKEAYSVFGVYDILARIEANTMEDIKNVISWGIRRLDRVRSTITMSVVDSK